MKTHPILFSGPMVRAILEGRKTQTRRIVKPQPPASCAYSINGADSHALCHAQGNLSIWVPPTPKSTDHRLPCPYGQPGDRLWVRETWQYADWTDDGYPFIRYAADNESKLFEGGIPDAWEQKLEDAWCRLSADDNYAIDQKAADRVWRPSIFLPRWASRITLEVTTVRVERLQDISEEDAKAEGALFHDGRPVGHHGWRHDSSHGYVYRTAKDSYAHLWESINGAGSWAENPWVWVIEFRRVNT